MLSSGTAAVRIHLIPDPARARTARSLSPLPPQRFAERPAGHLARGDNGIALSAQAVVPPLPYSLTPSPTFHRLATGSRSAGRTRPPCCGGQSSLVTTVDRIRTRPKPGISSRRSAMSRTVSAPMSKSPTAGCGTAVCGPIAAVGDFDIGAETVLLMADLRDEI